MVFQVAAISLCRSAPCRRTAAQSSTVVHSFADALTKHARLCDIAACEATGIMRLMPGPNARQASGCLDFF